MHKRSLISLAFLPFASVALLSSVSEAQTYKAPYAPLTLEADINGTGGGGTAKPLVAAARMAVKYYQNASSSESTLLATCKSKTAAMTPPSSPPSSWPDQCDFGGMVSALSAVHGGVWLDHTFGDTQFTAAVNDMIYGIKNFHSPSFLPLYGHADHWGTVYQVVLNSTNGALVSLLFRDSGASGQVDGAAPEARMGYDDGERFSSAVFWGVLFYKVITTVAPSDPYFNKFALSWDPPLSIAPEELLEMVQSEQHDIEVAPGLVDDPAEMDADVAQLGVMEALLLSGNYDTNPALRSAFEAGRPGPALLVHGTTPWGAPWDYYLVPVLTGGHLVTAMVQLSAEDGAFEQAWIPTRRFVYKTITPGQARASAQRDLASDEILMGGDLVWDARNDDPRFSSTFQPYYEFHVMSTKGQYRGGLRVAPDNGDVRSM